MEHFCFSEVATPTRNWYDLRINGVKMHKYSSTVTVLHFCRSVQSSSVKLQTVLSSMFSDCVRDNKYIAHLVYMSSYQSDLLTFTPTVHKSAIYIMTS